MNDRYLYRGKRVDNGEWVTGNLIQVDKPTGGVGYAIQHDFKPENEKDVSYITSKIDPATIGQCTGLRDKNGVLIYEGDIVCKPVNYKGKIHNDVWRGKVCYDVKKAAFVIKRRTKENKFMLGLFTFNKPSELEIIGNIHDNPELLKGGGASDGI